MTLESAAHNTATTVPVYQFNSGHTPDRRDYKGHRLCDNCWNGNHFHRKTNANGDPTGPIILDCLYGDCECLCRNLLAERRRPRTRSVEARKDPAAIEKKRAVSSLGERDDVLGNVQYSLFEPPNVSISDQLAA